MQNDSSRTIDILAFPDVQLLNLAGPLQVFATANDLATAGGLPHPYRPRVIARDGIVNASAGLGLVTHVLPDASEPCDTLTRPENRGGWLV